MAIIKVMNSKFGVSLSYHRIIAFNINYVLKKAVICVASYHSKEARANHSAPLEEIDIEVPESDFYLFSKASPIIQGYQWLKDNVVGFDDSIDDFEVLEGTTNAPSETETTE
jgi:hypothetical protein